MTGDHGEQISLRDFIQHVLDERNARYEQRFAAHEATLHAAIATQKEAISAALTVAKERWEKSEASSETRFKGQNEFRLQLTDQAATFVRRTEVEQIAHALDAKVAAVIDVFRQSVEDVKQRVVALEKVGANLAGRTEGSGKVAGPLWGIALAVAASLLSAGLLYALMKH